MKYGFNKVCLLGVIKNISTIRALSNGKETVNAVIVTPHRHKGVNGIPVQREERHNLSFYDNVAYTAQEILSPNTIAYVEGHLNYKIIENPPNRPSVFSFVIVTYFVGIGPDYFNREKDTFFNEKEIDIENNYNNLEEMP